MKVKSGGGIQSRVVKHTNAPKREPVAHRASPAGANQLGASVQFRKEPLQQGKGYSPGAQGSTGIANARQGPAGPGPGGGSRVIYKSGSQSPTPAPKEMEKGRDILRDYGKDYRR